LQFETFQLTQIHFETVFEGIAMKLAYGRVSAKDQNPERQLAKFRDLGINVR
jgi:hypothetical protein